MPTLVNFGGGEGDMPMTRSKWQLESNLCCRTSGRSSKRQRICTSNPFEQSRPPTIESLPDSCLFEILRRLPSSRERNLSAGVSKRWLCLVSSIHRFEIFKDNLDEEEENTGCLTRSLEGKEVTDVRLAAIAIGTSGRGGLGKLSIRGTHPARPVTDVGLSAIARGCPALRVLSVWNSSLISDWGLSEIAASCPMLEKLDLGRCPMITDNGLIAIGRLCRNLKSVTVTDCQLVRDIGITNLLCSASSTLANLSLEGLNVTDLTLACIGHYGKSIENLCLTRLPNVAERGFWVMGNALGLKNLRSIAVTACRGATDVGLEALAKGCPSLKHVCIRKCSCLSDVGLEAFAESAKALESLKLEECFRITLGFISTMLSCNGKLKTLSMVKCSGIRDMACFPQALPICTSLRCLTISDCPRLTSASLVAVGEICPCLEQLDLSGLVRITDAGLLPLVERSNAGLVKVNLKGCVNLTDAVVSTLVKVHGSTLKELTLDGCDKLTDKILLAVAECCYKLEELDMSMTSVTDYGVAVLASTSHLNLKILSFAGCSMLTNKIVPLLGNMGPSLVGLNLKTCNRISSNGIAALDEKAYWCDILS